MSLWQYLVRRGWKLFYIFYQICRLNVFGICKQWRLMMELFKYKTTCGRVAFGNISLIHLQRTKSEQRVALIIAFCSLAQLLHAFWRSKGRVKNRRHHVKCCCGLQGCAGSFTKTGMQRGMKGSWVYQLSVLYVECQATGTSSPLIIPMTLPCLWCNTSYGA